MDSKKYLRQLFLVGIYILGVFGIVASTGGGGDDDEDDDIIISSNYRFQLGGPLEGTAGDSVINIVIEGGISLTVEPDLQGQVSCDQQNETCEELQDVYAGSTIAITDLLGTDFDGDIVVTVENGEDWRYFIGDDQPGDGSFRVDEVGQSPIFVEFKECDSNSSGTEVEVTFDATVKCYQWDLFEDLFDSTDPSVQRYERQASFAWEVAEYLLLDQALNAALEVFPLVFDGNFAGGNPLNEVCESYIGMWAGGPVSPGNFTFLWSDDSLNNQVGPGDSFLQTFNDCWFGDSTEGALFNGSIDYVGFTGVIDFKNLLTRVGFETAASGSGKIGGVALNSLEITETFNDSGTITPEPKITLNGRYLIVFFE